MESKYCYMVFCRKREMRISLAIYVMLAGDGKVLCRGEAGA